MIANRNRKGAMGPRHVRNLELAGALLAKSFTAAGSIAAGDRVALRSDGQIEVIAGTRTDPAVGADATLSTPIGITSVAFNAATSKVAVWFTDTGSVQKVVIGSISGNTITWGTAVTIGFTPTGGNNRVAWAADGSRIFIAGLVGTTAMTVQAATVTGTVLAFGATATATVTSGAAVDFLVFDATAARLILFMRAAANIVAFAVSGSPATTLAAGTVATMTTSAAGQGLYDETNARFVWLCNTGVVKCTVATFSGTTATVGTETTVSSVPNAPAAALDAAGKLLMVLTASGNNSVAVVVTFSGTTPSAGTAVVINDAAVNSPTAKVVYDASAAKFVIAVTNGSIAQGPGAFFVVATISGASTVTLSATTDIPMTRGSFINILDLFALASSTYALHFQDPENYGYRVLMTATLVNGVIVLGEKFVPRVAELSALTYLFAMPSANKVFCMGNTGSSATWTAYVAQMPLESTNAGSFIGVAQAAGVAGQAVRTILKGGIASVASGSFTVGADYYLQYNGALSTTKNARKVGKALSSTELLLAA